MMNSEQFEKYGLWEKGNCLFSLWKGKEITVSNFTIKHIESNYFSVSKFTIKHIESNHLIMPELFVITNEFGYSVNLELNPVDFLTIYHFKVVTESCGNFIWLGRPIHFGLLLRMLYIQKGLSIKGGSHD